MKVVRQATLADIGALVALFTNAGDRLRGLTSLSGGVDFNEKRLAEAEAALDAGLGEYARFLFVLEDTSSGEILGTAGIGVPGHHLLPAFLWESDHRFVQGPVHDFDAPAISKSHLADGCAELQSLFLAARARGGGMGTLLSRSRLVLISEHASRFPSRFVSELRGVAAEDGSFPFWEGVGRHFTGLSSRQAEEVVAADGTMALGNMLPEGPIPLSLMSREARASLGRVHPSTEGARSLLFAEGFELSGLVNVLDAGPMPRLDLSDAVSVRQSSRKSVAVGDPRDPRRALVANTRWAGFRATLTEAAISGGTVILSRGIATALEVDDGDDLRVLTLGGQP